jgi:hypothetical protein
MDQPWWVNVALAAQAWATVAAVIVGGLWALRTYRLHRQAETAVDLQTKVQLYRHGTSMLAFVEVQLGNRGRVRIDASGQKPAYRDEDETVPCAGHLRIRPVAPGLAPGRGLHWFDGSTSAEADIEDDFLSSYETGGKVLFWLEPGECYRLGSTVLLEPGLYMGMATFIGSGPKEFWRQVFMVDARSPDQATAGSTGAVAAAGVPDTRSANPGAAPG